VHLVAALLVLTGAIAAIPASPAGAAFPGANGPIVYPCTRVTNGDLCRLDSETGTVTVIGDSSFPVHSRRVGVSPDGSLVAYSQAFGVFIRRIDGSAAPGVPGAPVAHAGAGDVSFTPGGASIVYRCLGGLCHTPITNTSGFPPPPIPGTGPGDGYPEVNPAGTTIAFVHGDILSTIPLAGGARTQLASGVVFDQVSWAPDGSRIAFTAGAGLCPVAGIATVPAGGGPVTCLPNGQGATDPSFSPDGTQIFVSLNGHAAFLGANGVGLRELPGVTGVENNNWAPRRAATGPRCAALLQQLDRTTDPRARATIQRFLAANRC
jgi:WD40 repeat protein